jgi:hypothetical protein
MAIIEINPERRTIDHTALANRFSNTAISPLCLPKMSSALLRAGRKPLDSIETTAHASPAFAGG